MPLSANEYLFYGVEVHDIVTYDNWLQKPEGIKDEDWGDDVYNFLLEWLPTRFKGVEAGIHRSPDAPVVFLHVNITHAFSGNAQEVCLPEIPREHHVLLENALIALGAPKQVIEKIGWWLASYYG